MIMTFSDHVLIPGCFGYFNLDSHFIHSIYKLANLDLMSNTSKYIWYNRILPFQVSFRNLVFGSNVKKKKHEHALHSGSTNTQNI